MSAETATAPAPTAEKPEVTNGESKEEKAEQGEKVEEWKTAEVGEKRKAEDDAGADDKK